MAGSVLMESSRYRPGLKRRELSAISLLKDCQAMNDSLRIPIANLESLGNFIPKDFLFLHSLQEDNTQPDHSFSGTMP